LNKEFSVSTVRGKKYERATKGQAILAILRQKYGISNYDPR